MIETGALKPETLTTAVLEVIAKRLGIRFEKLGLADTTRAAEPGTLYEFKPDELAELGKLPIEERNKREVTHLGGSQLTPDGALIRNPAFDVTPHEFIAGIITERGIFREPYAESLKQAFETMPGPKEPAYVPNV